MQSGYWKLAQWKNIPLFLHWSILLWLPWYWWRSGSITWAVLTFLPFVALLLAHELGHAIAARSCRVQVYMIVAYVLHGECRHEMAYRERDQILIAWGGVLAQLGVLVLALAAQYALATFQPETAYLLTPLFFVFIHANLVMAAFNLVPVAPLDGHKAWRVLPLIWNQLRQKYNNKVRAPRREPAFKKHKAAADEPGTVTYELLKRLKKK